MKKLSIEQKVKAYDEALSVARKTHQTQPMYRDWLEKMFPELAESEDEKIKKFLIQMAQNGHGGDKDWWNKCVAWLEAQGEKPQRIVSAEAKEAMYDKPAPVRTGAIGFDGEPMESKPCEQNPAWSEEDEKLYQSALWHIKNSCGNQGKTSGEYEVYHFVKSLKDRVQPQPKQEFGEYDDYEIGNILSHLKACLNEAAYSRYEKYLKSLRPQKQWKPTEEQMIAIKQAVRNMKESPCYNSALVSLCNDLKENYEI